MKYNVREGCIEGGQVTGADCCGAAAASVAQNAKRPGPVIGRHYHVTRRRGRQGWRLEGCLAAVGSNAGKYALS